MMGKRKRFEDRQKKSAGQAMEDAMFSDSVDDLDLDIPDTEPEPEAQDVIEPELSAIDQFRQSGIWIGSVQASEIGLVFHSDINVDEFENVGRVLLMFESGIQWCLGDWIAMGDNFEWGSTYERVASQFDVDIDTIRKYKQTAEKVQMRIRNPDLSFSHHRLVANMQSDIERGRWLNRAAEKEWTVSQLRDAIRATLPEAERKPNTFTNMRKTTLESIKLFRVGFNTDEDEQAEQALQHLKDMVAALEDMLEAKKRAR
jgi:hypothetical protein